MNPKQFEKKLKSLRIQIDRVDQSFIRILAQRMAVSRKMGILKVKFQIPVVQKKRWRVVISQRLKQAKKLKLDPHLVDRIFKEIHKGSIAVQKKVRRS